MKPGRPAVQVLVLGLLILGVFGTGLHAPLIYDDISLINGNPLVAGPWPGFAAYLLRSFGLQGEYEPLSTMLHWLVYRLAGEGVVLYHLSNLFLHWVNAALLLLLYRGLTKSAVLSFAAAALFCLYPGHTEVLAMATFKKHLLVSLFCLAILHLSMVKPRTAAVIAASWLCMLLALLSKESALIIPWFAVVFELAREPEAHDRPTLALYGGLFVVGGLFILFRTFIVPRYFPPPLGGTWLAHIATSLKCLFWYLSQLPLSQRLCLEHTLEPVRSVLEPQAGVLGACFIGLISLIAALWRSDRLAGLGVAWCGLFLLPFINILPFLNFSLVANRYLYFASAGFFLAAARLAQSALQNAPADAKRWAALACAPLIVFYGVADIKAMTLYADPYSLWTKTAHCAPDNPRAHTGLAVVYASNRQYTLALAEYKKAIELAPNFHIPYFGMAEVYAQTGRLAEAIELAEDQVRRDKSGGAYADLGVFYLDGGRKKEALAAFEKAAAIEPGNPGMGLNVGMALLALGRLDDAEGVLLDVVEAAPPRLRGQAFKLLGDVYEKKGMKAMAARLYAEALRLFPMRQDLALKLASLYAGQGRRAEAAAVLDEVLARLGDTIAAARAGGRDRDRELVLNAEKEYQRIKERRSMLSE